MIVEYPRRYTGGRVENSLEGVGVFFRYPTSNFLPVESP
jgi:hypothetical protein